MISASRHAERVRQLRRPRARRRSSLSTPGARIPGALDITCGSPCGKRTTSPASRRSGDSPAIAAQHEPLTTPWNSIMCSAPGMIAGMISAGGGRLGHPGRGPLDVVEERTAEADGAQQVGQGVSAHGPPPDDWRTFGQVFPTDGQTSTPAPSHLLPVPTQEERPHAPDAPPAPAHPRPRRNQGPAAGHVGLGRLRPDRRAAPDRRRVAVRGRRPARHRQACSTWRPATATPRSRRRAASRTSRRPTTCPRCSSRARLRAEADRLPITFQVADAEALPFRRRVVRRRPLDVRRHVRAEPGAGRRASCCASSSRAAGSASPTGRPRASSGGSSS